MDVESILEEINSREKNDRVLTSFQSLLHIMQDLRTKCPWDKKQTIHTLRMLTIEETFELAEAILQEDMENIKEEIGDVMLHMVFYAHIAEEQRLFNMADALDHICRKLIRRHPHIYGDLQLATDEEVKRNWEKLKLDEGKKSVLSGVPKGLPALIKAYRIQDKVSKVGFDWLHVDDVEKKFQEEWKELQDARQFGDFEKIEEEFGDVLFSLVNYARFLHVDPERALERTNNKFLKRFSYMESHADKPLSSLTLQEMEALWIDAKSTEKSNEKR